MPRRLRSGTFRPRRHGELEHAEDYEGEIADLRPADQETDDPADLDERDADREPKSHGSTGRVLACGPQPLRDERDPHDDVADDHRREVLLVERGGNAGRDHEYPSYLDERQQAVLDIVGVVGRCEPGEVHPRPPDREEDDQVVDEAVPDLPDDQVVVQRRRCARDGHDEAQVEQELEGCRGSMRLGRVTPGHRDMPWPHPRAGSDLSHQWRKCRVPVISIAPPTASTAATTSASRTEPPGWANAVTPAARQTSTASANG